MVKLTCNNKKRHEPYSWNYNGDKKTDEFTSCPKCKGSVKIKGIQ